MERIADILLNQDQLISRRQAHECGLDDNDLRRLVRNRRLAIVHPGVYVAHTGALTWHQRSWAAVLAAWPAALSHDSALRAANGPGRRDGAGEGLLHVAIGPGRKVVVPEGVVLHRTAHLSSRVHWNRSPPRMRIEEAALDVAAAASSDFDAVAVLAQVVSERQTTAARLLKALAGRERIARRRFLERVLTDVAQGTCSVLEHGYLTRVERPHGLPVAVRQAIDLSRGTLYRDVLYEEFDQVVELDGRIFHSGAHRRDVDLDRDLDAAVDGLATVRAGWGQVHLRACRTAARIALLLQRRGWDGEPRTCPACTPADWRLYVEAQPCRLQSPGDSRRHDKRGEVA
ncbi:hypothetical protein [Nocardioides sp. AE5]|uniref:hypothetical protein n=1 Tax=Nocardioides sp. AE5 TaxID=2962573 RepID=UPI002881EEBF|nr:hypothetical protein [Nocardioides sp. AE5]MDT0203738.1 hypothetical protein [Nocardioides sp. AE5]